MTPESPSTAYLHGIHVELLTPDAQLLLLLGQPAADTKMSVWTAPRTPGLPVNAQGCFSQLEPASPKNLQVGSLHPESLRHAESGPLPELLNQTLPMGPGNPELPTRESIQRPLCSKWGQDYREAGGEGTGSGARLLVQILLHCFVS